MTPEERKAHKVLELLKLADQDYVSINDFKVALDTLASIVDGAVEVNEKQKGDFVKYCTDQLSTIQGDCRSALREALERVAQLKDGRDGRDGHDGKDGMSGRDGVDGKDGKDGSPDMADDIRNKLELLFGEDRLDASAIKGLEKVSEQITENVAQRAISIVDQRSSFLINKAEQLRTDVNLKITGWNTHNIYVQSTAPTNPSLNDLWVDTT